MRERDLAYRVRFLGVVLVPAATLMALEIVSSRMLAPAFGNSVYVWGSIIGVFLAAMSAGYVLGGRLADARPQLSTLGVVLLSSAALQALTAAIGRGVVAAVGAATGGRPSGTLLAVALLFGPATAALAAVSPFVVRLAGRELARLGDVAGKLYALSTVGSLAGTLAATFWMVQVFDLSTILAILVSATALAAVLCAGRPLQVVAAAALAAVAWSGFAIRPASNAIRVERITPYQTLLVEEANGLRTLISDGTRHGAIVVETGRPALSYVHGAALGLMAQPDTDSLLVLGLGTGGVGGALRALRPELEITYVDIDPAVLELAREWFALDPRAEVVVDDARHFLDSTDRLWDFIYCDTYVGQSVPFHLATRDFFARVNRRLAPGGVAAVNVAGDVQHPFARAILRTLAAAFPETAVFRVPDSGNYLLLASREPLPPASELERRAAGFGNGEEAARYRRVARSQLREEVDVSDVPVLTDAFAPVDSLLNLGAAVGPGARLPEGPGER